MVGDPELSSSRESFVVSGPVLFPVSSTLSDRESSSRTNSFSEPKNQPVDFSSSDTVSPPVKENGQRLNLRDSVPHASEHLVSLPDISTVDSVSSMYPPFFSPPTIPFGIGSGMHNPVRVEQESGIGSYLPTGEHILQSMRHHGHSDSFSSHRSLEEIAYGDEDDYSYSQSRLFFLYTFFFRNQLFLMFSKGFFVAGFSFSLFFPLFSSFFSFFFLESQTG